MFTSFFQPLFTTTSSSRPAVYPLILVPGCRYVKGLALTNVSLSPDLLDWSLAHLLLWVELDHLLRVLRHLLCRLRIVSPHVLLVVPVVLIEGLVRWALVPPIQGLALRRGQLTLFLKALLAG